MKLLKSILRRKDAAILALIAEADAARDLGDWPRARLLYRQALDRQPHRAGVWAQYGHSLKETGFLHEAEVAYQAAIDGRPDRADNHVQMGHLRRVLGQNPEAADSYVRALELDPSSRPALDALRDLRGLGWSFDTKRVAVALGSAADQTAFWLDGGVEEAGKQQVRGWALDARPGADVLKVELWSEGEFHGSTAADQFRRDVQDRFGGSGLAGFTFRLDPSNPAQPGEIEIRDAASHRVIARANLQTVEPQIEAWRAVKLELAALARQAATLEAQLHELERSLAFDIEDYGAYFDALYRTEPCLPASAHAPPATVLLDVLDCPDRMIEDAVWSVAEQTSRTWSLILYGVRPDQVGFVTHLAARLKRRCGHGPMIAMKDGAPLNDFLAAVADAWVVTLSAGGVLAPDALARFSQTFEASDVDCLYGDEDSLDPDAAADFRIAGHMKPQLKPGFDPELLSQTPFTGDCIAFRTDILRKAGLREDAGAFRAPDALLRLASTNVRVGHIDRILYSRRQDAPLSGDWAACVANAVANTPGVAVTPHEDLLGATVRGAVRVTRRPDKASATIIVPTKDRVDLLKGCVDGILTERASWRTRTDLIVIDHDSEEAETRAYLSAIGGLGDVRIVPFSGPFNWALMNNRAAESSTADVLVFLNNDTLSLDSTWLDEMVAQALRPEVGVVGARLIYGDRSIQHAGIVSRDRPEAFLAHEGVGAPGSDAGYMGRHALMRSVVAVTGAAFAVRREVFEALDGFDAAHFPVEGNDVDFCMRAASTGLRVLYDPHATLFHLESKSRGFSRNGRKQAIAAAAANVLWVRWGARFGVDPGVNKHFDTRSRLFTRLTAPPS